MRDQPVTTVIDRDKCIGCGRCVEVCPADTLSMEGDKAVVSGDRSLSCGHCAAVCPVEAITVKAIVPGASHYTTFIADPRRLPEGEFDTAQLVRLMASRRSCRHFLDRPVAREVLEDLVRIGITAPSGTNCQYWTFTLLPTRSAVKALGDQVARFFRKTNKLAENALLRNGLKLLGQRDLDEYYRGYHETVCKALDGWEKTGEDRLFHGATAAMIVASAPGGSTSDEDALLATQNILLAAHTMGMGSCLIGFAVVPLIKDIRAKLALGIPEEERVQAVIALGYPDEDYLRPAGRKAPLIRYFEKGP